MIIHTLQNIPTMGANRNGVDSIMRKGVTENFLQLQFHDFAAGLWRALFGSSLEVINLGAKVRDEPVFVGFFQAVLFVRLLFPLFADGCTFHCPTFE